jgi:hypothetical protein
MNQKSMQRVSENYSRDFKKETGVNMPFVPVPAPHAHYFLQKSFALLKGSEDFHQYIGEPRIEDPTASWQPKENPSSVDAAILLSHEYFVLWIAGSEFLDALFQRVEEIESGTIVLPEQQQREQKGQAMNQLVQEYFSGPNLNAWGLALEKAAYFLGNVDAEIAAIAYGFSQLSDPGYPAQDHPFIQQLLNRSMELRSRQIAREEEEEEKASLIMSPQEFERSLNTARRSHREKK